MKFPNFEKILTERKISFYVLLLTLFIGACITVSFGWAVRHVLIANYDIHVDSRLGKFGEAIVTIAEFPSMAKQALREVTVGGNQVIIDRFPDLDGFKKSGKLQMGALEDTGYLLLSSYDRNEKQSTIRLIRIKDQQTLYEWIPGHDVYTILRDNSNKLVSQRGDPQARYRTDYRTIHPLLLKDGGMVISGDYSSPLFKLDLNSNVEWTVDGIYHHSKEKDSEGNIWLCGRIESNNKFHDDAIVKISPNGKLLYKKSVTTIFEENGFHSLLWNAVKDFSKDVIHLNDIQPALTDSRFWKKGDLMLSMRNNSTIALYRPNTNKIIWLKTGPWKYQHDVDFISDHEISVFGNDVLDDPEGRVLNDGHNNVYLYDFTNKTVSSPYKTAMELMEVRTGTEGLSEVLSNRDVFIEETTNGRLLRLTPDTAKWEFVRRVDKNHLSLLNWSRYLTEEQVHDLLPKLQNASYYQ